MLLDDLRATFGATPEWYGIADYRGAVIDQNVAGKATLSSRERTFRYLRELYGLDLSLAEFRAFRRLWRRDVASQPLMALLMSVHRDRAFAATTTAVIPVEVASVVTAAGLADAVEGEFPGAYSDSIRAKIGRNALSSWTQAGFLVRNDRSSVARAAVRPGPGAVAMALVLASLDGRSGQRLFDAPIIGVLSTSTALLHDRAHDCSRRGWLEYRSRGAVTEVDLSALTAAPDDQRMPLVEDDTP
jgi:hypothetical protein